MTINKNAPLKKASPTVIRNSCARVANNSVRLINADLKRRGYAAVTAKERDAALASKPKKKSDNNQSTRAKNGGAGRGQGRKKGAATKKTRAIADKLADDGGLTPLEYMLQTLRETPDELRRQHKAGEITADEFVLRLAKLTDRRDDAAKSAAPYIHPRLSSIEAKVESTGHERWLAIMEQFDQAS